MAVVSVSMLRIIVAIWRIVHATLLDARRSFGSCHAPHLPSAAGLARDFVPLRVAGSPYPVPTLGRSKTAAAAREISKIGDPSRSRAGLWAARLLRPLACGSVQSAAPGRPHGSSGCCNEVVDVETVSLRSGDLVLYGRLRHCAAAAPTLVLLSGVGFHTFEYEPLATELAAAGLNVLSFDFRGHGRSGGRRGRWTLEELVTDTRTAIDCARRRHDGPIGLFGNSLGAMIAVLTGSRDRRLAGVVAANCPARIGDFLLTRARRTLFALAKLTAPVAPLRISIDHFYAYEQLIDDPSWVSTIRRDPLIADARRLSAGTYRELLETWDGPQAARELLAPLLVIQGRHDNLQPPRQSELVFEAARSRQSSVDGRTRYELVDTGHLPHLEAPAMLAERLVEWMSEVGRPA